MFDESPGRNPCGLRISKECTGLAQLYSTLADADVCLACANENIKRRLQQAEETK